MKIIVSLKRLSKSTKLIINIPNQKLKIIIIYPMKIKSLIIISLLKKILKIKIK